MGFSKSANIFSGKECDPVGSKEMAGQGPELALSEADDGLQAFVREVTAALLMGKLSPDSGSGYLFDVHA